MKKQESAEKQLEAYKLYLTGMAKDTIASQLMVSHVTIDNWEKKGNWIADKERLKRETVRKVYGSIEMERERTLKLIHVAENIMAKKIQDNTLEVNLSSFIALERLKLDLIEPKSKNRLIDEEPLYKIEIIGPDGTNLNDHKKNVLKK